MWIASQQLGVPVEVLRRLPRLPLAESAVAAPHASFAGVDAYPKLAEKIAVLGWHLARNHPFPDANKRVAYVAMVATARMNDHELVDAGPDENDHVMRAVAAGTMTVQTLTRWVGGRLTQPP